MIYIIYITMIYMIYVIYHYDYIARHFARASALLTYLLQDVVQLSSARLHA